MAVEDAVTITGTFQDFADQATVPVVGTAEPAVLSISPAEIDFGSTPAGAPTGPVTVTVLNEGPAVTVQSVSVGDGFTIATDGCSGVTLAADGGTCTVDVAYAAAAPGDATGSLTVVTDATTAELSAELHGFATSGGLAVSPTSLEFGAVDVGTTSAPQSIVITNGANVPFTVDDVALASAAQGGAFGESVLLRLPRGAPSSAPFAVDASACPGVELQPGDSCTVSVTFAPTTAGQATDTLGISSTSGTLTVALSGTGAQPAAPAPPPSGPLPATGSGDGTTSVAVGACTLVMAGATALWLTRRRLA